MQDGIVLQVSLKKDVFKKANKNASRKKLGVEEYIENLVESDVSIVNLPKGFVFVGSEKKLYSPLGIPVNLTRREEDILEALIKNMNQVVSLEYFSKNIWDDRSSASKVLFSLRNFIKSIRDKTDYDLIKSISGIGYSIECNS